jgi:hypothetical protein
MNIKSPLTVWVDPNGRGAWDVALPDGPPHLKCDTLDAARKVAQLSAASRRPCELIVHDAYHRVIQRVIVDGGSGPSGV